MISCERLARDGDSEAGRGSRAEKGEKLVLHFLHVPHSRQLTFSTATLGWITTLKLRPFQRSTWNSHSALKLFNYIILLISVLHAIKCTFSHTQSPFSLSHTHIYTQERTLPGEYVHQRMRLKEQDLKTKKVAWISVSERQDRKRIQFLEICQFCMHWWLNLWKSSTLTSQQQLQYCLILLFYYHTSD